MGNMLSGRCVASALALGAIAPACLADPDLLTFEGLQQSEHVGGFYNGGLGSLGSGPGPNFGITFSANARISKDFDAGGQGNFGGEPSPDNVLFFLQGKAATLTLSAGFSTGFSFFYSAPVVQGFVTVYDGENATGNILATLQLPLTPFEGAPDPNGVFSPFEPIGVKFNGVAKSVDFGGNANMIAFDNITIGAGTPIIPLPTPLGLGAAGLAAGSLLRRRRFAS